MSLKVEDVIRMVLPRGTGALEANTERDWATPPITPIDLFAVAAYLLYHSAAYHRIVSDEVPGSAPPGSIVVKRRDVDRYRKAGREWSLDPTVPALVATNWTKLLADRAKPIFVPGAALKKEKWWINAYALLAVADEACSDVGYRPQPDKDWSKKWVVQLVEQTLSGAAPENPRSRHRRLVEHMPSIASALVDQDVVCIQPKARTPDVGCSLRNLSHNVALLPPRGVMRVNWLSPPAVQMDDQTTSLNLLLVPFPYTIETDCFAAKGGAAVDDLSGWFDVDQRWLRSGADDLVTFVSILLAEAAKHDVVHGLVFPELSLDYATYEKVATHLRDHAPSVQFLVAGSSDNCGGEKGNFALASHFFDDPSSSATAPLKRMMATASRAKHHRWSLNKSQIDAYGLSTAFPTSSTAMRWWEEIPLHARELHVHPMRGSSVFTVMICEDLARSDPAHEPLRAIGPNLVFVLLMDGPQLEWRWAARYSTRPRRRPRLVRPDVHVQGPYREMERGEGPDGPVVVGRDVEGRGASRRRHGVSGRQRGGDPEAGGAPPDRMDDRREKRHADVRLAQDRRCEDGSARSRRSRPTVEETGRCHVSLRHPARCPHVAVRREIARAQGRKRPVSRRRRRARPGAGRRSSTSALAAARGLRRGRASKAGTRGTGRRRFPWMTR